MTDQTELNLSLVQGTTFRQRLTIRDNGVPVALTDRVFKGQVVTKPGGLTLCNLTFDLLDQVTNPGEMDLVIRASVSKTFPLNPNTFEFIRPTVFFHSITVTYNDRPEDPEAFASGKVVVYPQAGS